MAETRAEAQRHFIGLALQYLIAGRVAVRLQLHTIPGNLLHHAIEMLLKSLLVVDIGLEEVKKRHWHSLPSLWSAAVEKHPDLASSEREATIEQLDRFESLRYPDSIVKDGAAILIGATLSGSMRVPVYRLDLDDIDELFQAIFKATAKNPKFYFAMLSEAARIAIHEQNQHPIG